MNALDEVVPLIHGRPLPRLGLGVFRIDDGTAVKRAVGWALEEGYRHVDTAAVYGNERGVGKAIRKSGLDPGSVFVTTKLWNDDHGYDRALRAFDASLRRLGMNAVDLYLIHWPGSDRRVETWRALERLKEEGRVGAIGVSNFMVDHMEEILAHCHTPPAVNQIELHPFNQGSRRDILSLCRRHGIVVEAYSPLTKGQRLDDPTVAEVARRHQRTPAQVLIRYVLQKDAVAVVKSSSRDRIRENARVFDFELDNEDMAALDALDEGYACSWDPTLV